MKLVWTFILALLTFLAVSSGIPKIILMQQDVEFFGRYGFTDPILITYGAAQLIGGILIPFRKTRFIGAAVVAMTFLVSLAVLLMDGNIPLSIITMGATLLLGIVMVRSWRADATES